MTLRGCEKCEWRLRYDRNPGSLLARLWKWHTRWCPGWKAFMKALPDDERIALTERHGLKQSR